MKTPLAPVALALSLAASTLAADLPIVDLRYVRQQATSFNNTGSYYSFNNIRYAAPPVGDLRWRAPVAPKKEKNVPYENGKDERICYQAGPAWFNTATKFLPYYLTGNGAAFYNASSNASSTEAPQTDPRETEDCLFLDVVVPKKIFDKQAECNDKGGKGAAVLVWIYGGGYTSGSKAGSGNPAGLLARSTDSQGPTGEGVVYVALNYRLGAFGFLAGPSLASNGQANAGLLDQRFALEWVQKNIHLFGGDKNRVTIVGESAGGGSIMHQITAHGGKGKIPFQQAIPQSAAWVPIPSNYQQENTTINYLRILNVSSVAEARKAPAIALASANALLVGLAPYGSFVFSPVVDGDFVPALPGQLLLQGNYHKDVKLLIGHNAEEALLFTSPYILNDTALFDYLKLALPVAQPEVLSYITNTLYPQPQNTNLGYKDEIQRAAFLTSEAFFTCNTNYLARAFGNKTYNYLFNVPPALHGQDVPYTFYGSGTPTGSSLPVAVNETVAYALQNYITDFAATGNPNSNGVPQFNLYGEDAQVLSLGSTAIQQIADQTANPRCLWWQKALYF